MIREDVHVLNRTEPKELRKLFVVDEGAAGRVSNQDGRGGGLDDPFEFGPAVFVWVVNEREADFGKDIDFTKNQKKYSKGHRQCPLRRYLKNLRAIYKYQKCTA